MTTTEKTWTVDEIKALLKRSDKAVTRAVLAIYRLQTVDEQCSQTTKEYNGVGFNAIDSELMSSFAIQLLQGRTLSIKQLEIARKRMMKYSKQLMGIANAR